MFKDFYLYESHQQNSISLIVDDKDVLTTVFGFNIPSGPTTLSRSNSCTEALIQFLSGGIFFVLLSENILFDGVDALTKLAYRGRDGLLVI